MLVDMNDKELKMPNGQLSIIISAMPGAGKSTLAEIISKKMGLKMMVGGDILKKMAEEQGYKVTGSDWWETNDAMEFLAQRKTNPDFDKRLDKLFIKELEKGGIVLTSWTMPWLSKYGYKIWLNTNFETRSKRLSNRDKIPLDKAKEVLKKRDKENKELYKNLYNIDYGEDLAPFDLVINANIYNAEELSDAVVSCLKILQKT